jgi:Domain of unknown function (DUF4145)
VSEESLYVGVMDNALPETLTTVCGYCGVAAALRRVGPGVSHGDEASGPGGQRRYHVSAAYVCPRDECHRQSLLLFEFESHRLHEAWAEQVGQIPRGTAERMEGLPSAIESVRREAWSCFYGGDYRAALVMGRAAIQRAVRSLGASGRDLYSEIDDLAVKGKVTNEVKEWAHEVRLAAREAAHPEDLGDVSADEANESLEFADAFLTFAVALPAKRTARRQSETQS